MNDLVKTTWYRVRYGDPLPPLDGQEGAVASERESEPGMGST